MSDQKALAIVYQFGKVASTSIVKSLNNCPGVEAHQSHFLGEDALKRMVSSATDTNTNPYFHKHIVGQFMTNLELTYNMNRAMKDAKRKLVVLNLTRDPIDWLRSCIQQDVEGYFDDIVAHARTRGIDAEGDEALFTSGLTDILRENVELIEAKGGIQETLNEFTSLRGQAFFKDTEVVPGSIVAKIWFLVVRPLIWFEDHFEKCFSISFGDFSKSENHWEHINNQASFVILRYEDIASDLVKAMASVGIEMTEPLAKENLSRNKPHSSSILSAFNSTPAELLRNHIKKSHYCVRYGYTQDR